MWCLWRPVARRTGAVFFAADDDQRHAVRRVFHRRIVDRICSPDGWCVVTPPAPGTISLRMRILGGAAHHHFVVAPARAVGIKLCGTDLAFQQIFARRAFPLDRAAGEMWSVVTESRGSAAARADDIGDLARFPLHALEEGRY